ncbi:PREDICTED: monocarboxylate transporter 12-like, partial [Priapulus caudatus]|uniref:Monocarboxylate transporter 12-like n=1 Tax=Priapulus caudatus TaxID=37621 RepID=A0ABM1DU04_PRICU
MVGTISKDKPPPDGGWGWLCACGGFLVHFISAAQLKAFGVFLPVLTKEFGTSNALTAWTNGIGNAVFFMLTPLSTGLCHRYSYRTVAIPGAIIAGVGMSLSYFATGLPLLYLTYGLMFGLGSALIMIPSQSSVADHFDKKRSVAIGIVLLGTGVGTLVWPILIGYLLEEFLYQRTFLICGAITFNLMVAGSLFRNFKKRPPLDSTFKSSDNNVEMTTPATTPRTWFARMRDSIKNSKPIIDKRIFTDSRIVHYCLTLFFVQVAYISVFVLLPTRGQELADSDDFSGATLVSVIGLSETISRLPWCAMWDISFLRKPTRRLAGLTIFVFFIGVLVIINPLMHSMELLVVNSAILGVATGGYVPTSFIVLVDLSGVDLYKDALAARLWFAGLASLLGPAFLGMFPT